MRRTLPAGVLALCAALLSGCVPMMFTDSMPMTVHVADAASGKPVAGAVVTYVVRYEPERRQTVRTDSTGTADIPGMSHRRWLPLLPIDYMLPAADIAVDADGYASRSVSTQELWGGMPDPRCSDKPGCPPLPALDVIALTPNPR